MPTTAPPCDRELMRPYYIQDFHSSACRERVGAKHRETLIGYGPVERVFVFTEVVPMFPFEPGGVTGYSDSGVTFSGGSRQLLIPTGNYSLEIKRAILQIPVASRDDLDAIPKQVASEIGNGLLQRLQGVLLL